MEGGLIPYAACKIEIKIILEVAVRNWTGFDFGEIQPAAGKAGKHAVQRARGMRQGKNQADFIRLRRDPHFTGDCNEAGSVVFARLDIAFQNLKPKVAGGVR